MLFSFVALAVGAAYDDVRRWGCVCWSMDSVIWSKKDSFDYSFDPFKNAVPKCSSKTPGSMVVRSIAIFASLVEATCKKERVASRVRGATKSRASRH